MAPQSNNVPAGIQVDSAPDVSGLSASSVPAGIQIDAAPDLSALGAPKSESTFQKIGDVVRGAHEFQRNVDIGMAKGVGSDVATISGVLNKIPGVGEYLAPTQGVSAFKKEVEPQGVEQKIGMGAESLLEFMAGDESLKGLSLAEKLDIASKIAKTAEYSDKLAKAMYIGMNALRGGAVGTAEGLVKGQTPTQAAETGVGAMAGTAAMETAGELGGMVKSAVLGERGAQRAAAAAYRNPWADARTASISNARQFLEPRISDATNMAQRLYHFVDDRLSNALPDQFTGFSMQAAEDEIDRLTRKIPIEVNPAVKADMNARLTYLKGQQRTAEGMLGPNGMKAWQDAKTSFMRSKALQQVQQIVRNAADPDGKSVNIQSLLKGLTKLDENVKYGQSRLVQAIGGPDADAKAQQMLKELTAARDAGKKAVSARRTLEWLGGGGLAAYIAHRTIFDTARKYLAEP